MLLSNVYFSRNANLKAYLGETKMKMLQEFGAIKEKYGAQPASCENVFKSTCPWDSAGMSSIFMKLMVSFHQTFVFDPSSCSCGVQAWR